MKNLEPKIMVIEDEPLLLKAIKIKLELNGFITIVCQSGQEALNYLEKNIESPDIIWLDYYLKDMNGLEFMNNLKKNHKCFSIPVIVVSNSASPEKVHHMLALGAKKYLLKSQYKLEEIIEIMRGFIESKEIVL